MTFHASLVWIDSHVFISFFIASFLFLVIWILVMQLGESDDQRDLRRRNAARSSATRRHMQRVIAEHKAREARKHTAAVNRQIAEVMAEFEQQAFSLDHPTDSAA